MQVWSVSNQKGGVGKTTTSVTLAGLAYSQNRRVLLIDIDPHGSLTSYFKYNPDTLTQSVFTLFKQRKQLNKELVHTIIKPTNVEGMDLLPAATALATLERQAIGDGMGLVIARTILQVKEEYDLVIIDCPPQLGVLMVNALAACTQLIVPVQTEHLAIQGLERMLHTITMLSKSQKKNIAYTIVPTMFDRRTQASVSSLRLIRTQYSDNAWKRMIPIDTKLRDASKAGELPHIFSSSSRAVEAYTSLYSYIMAKEHTNQASSVRPKV